MKKFIYLYILLFLSCSTLTKISNQNVSHLYKKNKLKISPSYIIFNISDTISRLYFKINPSELLYTRDIETGSFMSVYKLSYKLLKSFESKIIVDSSNVIYRDSTRYRSNINIVDYIDIKAKKGSDYALELDLTDINRKNNIKSFLSIYKENVYGAQNFLVQTVNNSDLPATLPKPKGAVESLPLFRNYLKKDEQVEITYRNVTKKLYVKHFYQEFPIASPPFSVSGMKPMQIKPDSIFNITLNERGSVIIDLPKRGFYYFQADTTINEGLTLFRFSDDFPLISSPTEFIQPLRYITTAQEFKRLIESDDKKRAIDNFWLSITGNPDRARELIKAYYRKIKEANEFFTSYHEGWKTDRGMIYIIYGTPDIVYKTSSSEVWIYSETISMMTLSFTFNKVKNPYTDNDYVLDRSASYKNSWYYAVDFWRSGRAPFE